MWFLNSIVLINILLQTFSCASNENQNETFSNNGNLRHNGKTYFLQLRNTGDGNNSYRTVWRKNLNNKYDSNNDGYEIIGNILQAKETVTEYEKKPIDVLDEEWNTLLKSPQPNIPDIIANFYESMNTNELNKIQNASTIRCIVEADAGENELFKFNLDSMEGNEDMIIDAELFIYRYQNELYKNYDTSNYVARLYQILPNSTTNEDFNTSKPDVHKLLNVVYVSAIYDGWQIFKVKTALEAWLSGEENLGFIVSITDASENVIDLNFAHKNYSDIIYQPFLAVYLKKKDDHKRRTENSKALTKSPSKYFKNIQNVDLPCSRHIWYVNFQDLGWENFILAPRGYIAYKCKGSCFSSLNTEYTNHGKLLKFYQDMDNHIGGPGCAPTDFKPLVLMFYDKYENIVIKTYQDMIVEKCGCR